jgi:hypothetical protein
VALVYTALVWEQHVAPGLPEFSRFLSLGLPEQMLYSSVSQTVVRGPQVVLGFCPGGPLRLNSSPKKTEQIKLT